MLRITTVLFLLLSIVSVYSQSMSSVCNRDSIIKRLAKTCHPDNKAYISFSDSETKEKIKDVRVEIIELSNQSKKPEPIICKNGTYNQLAKTSDGVRTNFNVDPIGGLRFPVRKGMDYLISVKNMGFEEKDMVINWLELLQNNEISILLKKTECKYITGLLTLKKMQLSSEDIVLKVVSIQDDRSTNIPVNALGQFVIACEYNKDYRVEIYERETIRQVMDIPLIKKNQGIGNLQINTNDFSIVFQDDKLTKSSYRTLTFPTGPLNKEYTQKDIIDHFLNKKADQIKTGMVFQLSNYFYDYENLVFSDEAKAEFDLITKLMLSNPKMKISVNVHTDNIGSPAFCKQFSYNIAEKISRCLILKGVDKNHIIARGMGCAFPLEGKGNLEPNSLEKMLANRRAEIEILDF